MSAPSITAESVKSGSKMACSSSVAFGKGTLPPLPLLPANIPAEPPPLLPAEPPPLPPVELPPPVSLSVSCDAFPHATEHTSTSSPKALHRDTEPYRGISLIEPNVAAASPRCSSFDSGSGFADLDGWCFHTSLLESVPERDRQDEAAVVDGFDVVVSGA
jgi:hypothetical protein